MALTAKQRETIRDLLERERRKLVRRLKRFNADMGDLDSSAFSQHMAEAAAASAERERAFLMAGEEGEHLVEVDRALARLTRDPETYGVCRDCGTDIAFERMEAIPSAQLCIDCKRQDEAGG